MKTVLATRVRRLLAVAALSLCAQPAVAAGFYATPTGSGSQDGSSWANAAPQSQIQSLLDGLQPGDTLNLGSGSYTLASLTINGSGTVGNPKTLLGVDTGGGVPLFQGSFDVNNTASTSFMSVPGAAHYWTIKNLRFEDQPFTIDMPLNGTTDTLRSNFIFENLQFDTVEDCIRIRNVNNVQIKNCTMIRYTKRGVRIGRYSSFVTVSGCSADATGGNDSFPTRSIPFGFALDSTNNEAIIHDIEFVDCVARNNRFVQSPTAYWNGDGFSSERGAYNITFRRCQAYDNHDAGYDNKATDITYVDSIAAGNKRGFRHWGPGGQMNNCISAFAVNWGGSGGPHGIWISMSNGALTMTTSTVHDNSGTEVYVESGGTGTLTAIDSLISTSSATAAFTSGNVTLTNTSTWRPGSGTDPAYVNPVSSWRGDPTNAMDSQTYGLTKGYNSTRVTGGDTEPPSVPTNLAANSVAHNAFNLTWSASTDNVGVTGYEVFRDGVSIATPSGTSATVTGLAAGTTYAMTVRARDAAANWSAQSVPLNVTTASGTGAIRIESANSSPLTDSSGNVWTADYGFDAGTGGTVDRGAIEIANTIDDRIYQTERWGLAGYAIPVANGLYTVELHFAETFSGITAAGQRVFTVTAEGISPTGWTNIDVFAEAGGRNIALIKSASVTVADGTLNLGFTASVNNPMISGIAIIPAGPDTEAPSVPTGLASSAITENSFTLSWNPSTDNVGVTGYEVFRDGVSIATPTGTSVSVTGLSPATTYAMTVRARDAAANWSAQSAPLNVTTSAPDTEPPSVPTGLASSDITQTSFTLSWNASTDNVGVTGYQVFRDGLSIATPTGTSISVTGLSPGTTYAMTVRATDAAGNWSAQSSPLNVTTSPPDTTPPSVPTGLAATDLAPDSFTLTWNASTDNIGVTGYEVFRDAVSYTTTAATSAGITGLSASTSYAMTVRATDAAGNWSAQSSPLNVTTPSGRAISVNLGGDTDVLAAGDIVGAVPVANWNNSTLNNQTLTNLIDSTGVASTADITFANTAFRYANNTADPGAPLTDDALMMRSQRALSNNTIMRATLSEVPYTTYAVYVYWGGRTSAESVPHTMEVAFQLWNGTAWVTQESKFIRDDNRVWDTTYDESTATTAAAAVDGQEYVVFRNVTATTFRIEVITGKRTGLCGLQVVEQ